MASFSICSVRRPTGHLVPSTSAMDLRRPHLRGLREVHRASTGGSLMEHNSEADGRAGTQTPCVLLKDTLLEVPEFLSCALLDYVLLCFLHSVNPIILLPFPLPFGFPRCAALTLLTGGVALAREVFGLFLAPGLVPCTSPSGAIPSVFLRLSHVLWHLSPCSSVFPLAVPLAYPMAWASSQSPSSKWSSGHAISPMSMGSRLWRSCPTSS